MFASVSPGIKNPSPILPLRQARPHILSPLTLVSLPYNPAERLLSQDHPNPPFDSDHTILP